MSKKSWYLLGILLIILAGAILYYFFCCCACKKGERESIRKDVTLSGAYHPFSLDGKDFHYFCYDNFRFPKNDFKFLQPAGDSINTGIDLLIKNFNADPGKRLVITGYCTRDERDTSSFPNLGFARAEHIKDYFVSKGFDPSLLKTKGEIVDSWRMKDDIVLGPVSYAMEDQPDAATGEAEAEWIALKEKLRNPVILYFNVNESEVILNSEEKEKITDVIKYLSHFPDARLQIVGHTDNSGNYDKNVQLGQDRADFIKSYLIQKGIDAGKIASSSKGPDEPVADNTTAEGKAKNRRTVISIP